MWRTIPSLVMLVLVGATASAQAPATTPDTPENRRSAALRYMGTVPTEPILADMIAELAKRVPDDKRAQFVELMRKGVPLDRIDALTLTSLVKHFTVAELDALTAFYGSPEGKSVMKKFGVYMGEMLPAIQAEVLRALQQVREEMKI